RERKRRPGARIEHARQRASLSHPERAIVRVDGPRHRSYQQRRAVNTLALIEYQLRLIRRQTDRKGKALGQTIESCAPTPTPLQTEIDPIVRTADDPVRIDAAVGIIRTMQPAAELDLVARIQ